MALITHKLTVSSAQAMQPLSGMWTAGHRIPR